MAARHWLNIMFFGLLPAVALSVGGCGVSESSPKQTPTEPKAVKVKVSRAVPEPIRDLLALPGETEARHDVTVASEREGQVDWIGPREGQDVERGRLIMKVDVAALKAALDRAEASFKMAADRAQRRTTLHSGEIVAKEALEQAVTERDVALANLNEARVNYEQGLIRSPLTGALNKLLVEKGEFVKRGQAVAEIVYTGRIRINVRAPEMDVRFLEVGQGVLVTVDAYPGEKWMGSIDFVALKADPATKTFKTRIVVANADNRIRPGMIAHVTFLKRIIPDALTAPLFAILDRGGERIVFVEEDGTARARTVSVGVIDGDRIQIVNGLEPGDNLIVTGQHDVEEGMRVIAQ